MSVRWWALRRNSRSPFAPGVARHSGVESLLSCRGKRLFLFRDNVLIMKITFKLFATLTDYLPPEARTANQVEMDVAPDATILQIIEPFGLPLKLVHLVLVNGKYIAPEQRGTTTLTEGDVLAIWPPIAGG